MQENTISPEAYCSCLSVLLSGMSYRRESTQYNDHEYVQMIAACSGEQYHNFQQHTHSQLLEISSHAQRH